ncbi:unnamed protein product [Clonostachys solani]|uniref:Uncharacterized protein n=1 Tax=Clonostachys solani TaxID=160281 RepID=A0A9N9Z121_9HYPO|nr:unnamed protein product [Clonostachys solani]
MGKAHGIPELKFLHEIITDEITPSDDFALAERCARIQTEWIRSRPNDWNKCDMSKLPTIEIHFESYETKKPFLSRLLGRQQKGAQWRAVMKIWTCNTPRLMRQGVYWGPDDVNEVTGFVRLDDNRLSRAWGWGGRWKHMRAYNIQPPGDKVEWHGSLYVFTQEAATLARFDLSCITPETAVKMSADNWQKRLVYLADRRRPDLSFNTIFGSMPLKGWWIWPKAGSSISERTTVSSSNMALECPKNSPTTDPNGITERFILFVRIDRDLRAAKPYSKVDENAWPLRC